MVPPSSKSLKHAEVASSAMLLRCEVVLCDWLVASWVFFCDRLTSSVFVCGAIESAAQRGEERQAEAAVSHCAAITLRAGQRDGRHVRACKSVG